MSKWKGNIHIRYNEYFVPLHVYFIELMCTTPNRKLLSAQKIKYFNNIIILKLNLTQLSPY